MELSRHAQVLWRFRVILVLGVLAGLVLATGTLFSVSSSGLAWKQQLTYKSSSTLFVTQAGFPWGRANLPTASGEAVTKPTAPDQNFAEPARFAGLASIYSFLVRGQEVRALIPGHPQDDQIAAEPFASAPNGNGDTLPLIGLVTTAATPTAARALNAAAISALTTYIGRQQRASRTPPVQRAQIQVLNPPSKAVVAQGRSLTGAIVLLLLCVVGAVALAYIIENLRPRPGRVDELVPVSSEGAGGEKVDDVDELWTRAPEPEPAPLRATAQRR